MKQQAQAYNIPTLFETRMNEFNQFTTNLASNSLGMDARFQPGMAIGPPPGQEQHPQTTKSLNINATDYVSVTTSALTLINFGVRYWRKKNGLDIGNDVAADASFRQNLQMKPIPESRWQESEYNKLPSSSLNSINISDTLPYIQTNPTARPFELDWEHMYKSYDTGNTIFMPDLSSIAPPPAPTPGYNNREQYPGYINQEQVNVPELKSISENVSEQVKSLLENESEQVKNLAKLFNIKTYEEFLIIKNIVKDENEIKQRMSSISSIKSIPSETISDTSNLTLEQDKHIGPNNQRQFSSSSEIKPPYGNILKSNINPTPGIQVNETVGIRVGNQYGGKMSKDFFNNIFYILNRFIRLEIYNGQMFFLIKDNKSENFIKSLSIINSINFIENFKDIQQFSNNTISYNNINNFTNDCYSFLSSSLIPKVVKNKTKKNMKKYKKKTQNKNKKNIKKTNKNNAIKRNKITRKY